MQLLDYIDLKINGETKLIQLFHGDLTEIPKEEAVDILLVSAIPGYYDPVPGSLIYSLFQKGVNVKKLARDKKHNYLKEFSCWMSQDIESDYPGINFRNIVVFEPQLENYRPTELVSDIFRAIFPFAADKITKIATPLLSTRSMLWGRAEILSLLVETAYSWMSNGLQLNEFKIVIFEDEHFDEIFTQFTVLKQRIFLFEEAERREKLKTKIKTEYDIFISYSHRNSEVANQIYSTLKELNQSIRIFIDKLELQPGRSWQQEIYNALEKSDKVLALLSPHYLESKVCIEEFDIALLRNRESENQILFPVLIDKTKLPYYMRSIQYITLLPEEIKEIKTKLTSVIDLYDLPKKSKKMIEQPIQTNNLLNKENMIATISELKKVYNHSIPIQRISDKRGWEIRNVLNEIENLIINGDLNAKINHGNDPSSYTLEF